MVTLVMNRMTSLGMVTLVMVMNRMTLVYRDGDTGDDDEQDDMSLQGWYTGDEQDGISLQGW